MVRGFYSAAAGVLTQQKVIDTVSNNIANTMTTGYKSQKMIQGSFGDHLVSRMSSNLSVADPRIGTGSFMTVNPDVSTDFTQGQLEYTGRSVDMAIQGDGFFLVKTEKNGNVLSRNGQFELDKDGFLILPNVGKVLDKNMKEIKLPNSAFEVTADGIISNDGVGSTSLNISIGKTDSVLKKIGEDSFLSENGYQNAAAGSFRIMQRSIEKANVNLATEMSKIIASQSHFHSCTQILKIYDRINEMSVNQIARIG